MTTPENNAAWLDGFRHKLEDRARPAAPSAAYKAGEAAAADLLAKIEGGTTASSGGYGAPADGDG